MEGLRLQDILGQFLIELRTMRPALVETLDAHYTNIDYTAEIAYISEVYRPLALECIKKDDSIFGVPRFFLRNIDFSLFWADLTTQQKDTVWDFLRSGLVASYIGEDWIKSLKDLWTKFTGKESSEIDEILDDSSTKNNIEELFEFFKETRIFKLGMEMLETLKIEQFGLEHIDFSDPAKILDMLKNPDNEIMKKAIGVVGGFVEAKIRSGSLRKEDLVAEMEMLREKFKHSLGRIFKESVFGEEREAQRAEVLLSNHPDARRARMLARLQRKVQERQK